MVATGDSARFRRSLLQTEMCPLFSQSELPRSLAGGLLVVGAMRFL